MDNIWLRIDPNVTWSRINSAILVSFFNNGNIYFGIHALAF